MAKESWSMKGELVLACNCKVFCPCVLSLGDHPPSEGYCQTWAGFRIDDGHFGDVDLSGINLGLMMEIPGYMSRGNWTAGLFIDERASIYASKALTKIFYRQGGWHHPFAVHSGWKFSRGETRTDFLRNRWQDPECENPENSRWFSNTPLQGKTAGEDTVIKNSQYWIAEEIIVARSNRSRFRAFGRNWNFEGLSAEVCKLDWHG